MIKGIVFDLDGTLYDRYSTLRMACYMLHREYREWFPEELSAKELGRQVVKVDHRVNYFGGWKAEAIRLQKDGVLHKNVDPGDFATAMLALIAVNVIPYPFTREMLASLRRKGLRLGMITNGVHEIQWTKLRTLNLNYDFEQVIISGDYGISKPDGRLFKICAEEMHLDPSELIYVGDNPELDVLGAYNGGFTPIWVKTAVGWGFPEIEHAPYEINDVSELEAVLDKILEEQSEQAAQ